MFWSWIPLVPTHPERDIDKARLNLLLLHIYPRLNTFCWTPQTETLYEKRHHFNCRKMLLMVHDLLYFLQLGKILSAKSLSWVGCSIMEFYHFYRRLSTIQTIHLIQINSVPKKVRQFVDTDFSNNFQECWYYQITSKLENIPDIELEETLKWSWKMIFSGWPRCLIVFTRVLVW